MLRDQCDDYQAQVEELHNALHQHEMSCNLVLTGQMKPFSEYPTAPSNGHPRARHISSSSSNTTYNSFSSYGDCCYADNCLETSVTPPMASSMMGYSGPAIEDPTDHMLSDEITEFVFEHNN